VAFEVAHSQLENDSEAEKWMSSPVQSLGLMRSPNELGAKVEANAVLDLIGRLERGGLL
jgi:uncharacterized protein (DUF2384 family)